MDESVTRFEQVLGKATRAAETAVKSASDVAKSARKARKAALVGDIAAIGRCPADLDKTIDALSQAVATLEQAISCAVEWPVVPTEEQPSFANRYSAELREAAAADGLGIHERDGALISYPTVIRVGPDRSLIVNQKKIRTVRPSHVISLLRAEQAKVGQYRPERFLDSLYLIYEDILRDHKKRLLETGSMPTMALSRIYKHLTALPGASRGYTKTDFARDLYVLDSTGPKRAKKGKGPEVIFSGSSGTRATKDYFSFVGPDGYESKYYGIQFVEAS